MTDFDRQINALVTREYMKKLDMTLNVIQIGEAKLKRIRKDRGLCSHLNMEYEPTERTVKCLDCDRYFDGFDAFLLLIKQQHNFESNINRKIKELKELEERNLTLKAAKQVETAWRRRKMVPACPHCGVGIHTGDNLGGTQINKKRDLEQRKFKGINPPR